MRTSLAVLLLALVPACLTNEITGLGGADDGDDVAEGDDMGSGSGSDTATARVVATLDKTSLTTENGKTETVTVTLTSENGFAGDVTIAKSLVDSANAAIPMVTLEGPASVTLAAGATATATFTITLPPNTTGSVIDGALDVALSSSAGTVDLTSQVTINNFYTVVYPAGTGTTATNHPMAGASITVKRGTIVKFPNDDTITHIIHGGGTYSGDHEDQTAGGSPGRTYEVQTIGYAPGSTGTLGCHSHGTASYATIALQ